EDGIRDGHVTGVQTCALPISRDLAFREPAALDRVRQEMADELVWRSALQFAFAEQWRALRHHCARRSVRVVGDIAIFVNYDSARSEERRVGKRGGRWC